MIVKYCDVCKKQREELYPFRYSYNLTATTFNKRVTIIDGICQPMYERIIEKELCLICYNTVMLTALEKMEELCKNTL